MPFWRGGGEKEFFCTWLILKKTHFVIKSLKQVSSVISHALVKSAITIAVTVTHYTQRQNTLFFYRKQNNP